MRYVILLALLMCLPVRGEAWQVVGGGVEATGTSTIFDDFSTDTATNYTAISGAITVSSGSAKGANWTVSRVYHETPTGSTSHWVSGTCNVTTSGSDSACLLFGGNGIEYYLITFSDGELSVFSNDGQFNPRYNGGYYGSTYTVVAQVDTDSNNHARITVWVDGVKRIDGVSDTEDSVDRGQYVGFVVDNESDGVSTTNVFDNLEADAGAYTP